MIKVLNLLPYFIVTYTTFLLNTYMYHKTTAYDGQFISVGDFPSGAMHSALPGKNDVYT